jgi:CheY-like chemotaxis protein
MGRRASYSAIRAMKRDAPHAAPEAGPPAAARASVLGALASAHIVITDIFLPGEDGVWLLAQVQQLPRAIPVIALTGISPAHDPQLAAAGFARTFLKPIDPWDLCQVIAEILERGA